MGSEGHCPPEQEHLDNLVKRCVDFAEQSGRVSPWLNPIPELFSNGVYCYDGAGALVECKYENLTINVSCFLTLDHDGLWLITVREENRVVLKTSSRGVGVRNVKAEVYIPGEWEKKITPRPKAPLPPLSDWTEAFPDPPTTKPKRR